MSPQSILQSPDQYLQSFDQAEAVMFEMDRDAYARSIFLDRRIAAKNMDYKRIPRADLLGSIEAAPEPRPIAYIFHIAHCGSTLLARALDLENDNLVLREPYALRQLGVEAATARSAEYERTVRLVRTLLARRYNRAGPVIVKANVPVNFMIADLMRPQADHPAIFLHYGLEDYLLAILRSPMHRTWVGHVVVELAPGIEALTGQRAGEESVAILAARLWLAQVLLYDQALGEFTNTKSLSAEALFESPSAVIGAAFDLFGQPQSAETIAGIVASDLFQRYSKDPRHQFDNAQRIERRAKLKIELAAELGEARAWVQQQPASRLLPQRLPRSLVGEGCVLVT